MFQELITQAHDMEVTIAYYGRQFNDDGSITSSTNRSSMLRDSEEMNVLIMSLMRPKYFTNFLRKDL